MTRAADGRPRAGLGGCVVRTTCVSCDRLVTLMIDGSLSVAQRREEAAGLPTHPARRTVLVPEKEVHDGGS